MGYPREQPLPPERPFHNRMRGYWLLQARRCSGIPQAALARELDVPLRKLSRLERGLDPVPAWLLARAVVMLKQPEAPASLR